VKASLRVAWTLFSFEPLQSWVLLACGVVAGIAMLARAFDVAAIFAMFMVMNPAFNGGRILRIVSSPTVLNLRPHGRLRVLLGATGTITLVAMVWTLPVLVFQVTGWRVPDRSATSVFSLPAQGSFVLSWGATAGLWVWAFFASRSNVLFGFSWIPMGGVVLLANALHLPAQRLAGVMFVAGAVAWTAFAGWYLGTSSVTRPREEAGGWRLQSPLDPGQLLARLRSSGARAAGNAPVPRAAALCQYLVGSTSTLPQFLLGTLFAVLWTAAYQFYDRTDGRVPVEYVFFLPLFAVSISLALVRRARLVWLRTGLDRAGLFATAERQALRAVLATCSVPAVVLVAFSLNLRTDLAAQILLFAMMQLVANACFIHAGLAVTRGWDLVEVLRMVGLGLLFVVMTIVLQPHRGAFIATYVATIVVFAALAIAMRRAAARAWRDLDWRVAGPLPAGVGPRKS
jgi:hypothetical protein